MTFWTDTTNNPTRQFRFMISNGLGDWWWASSVSKPSYEINTEEYKLINHKFKYPGVATWNDVTITIVDVSKQAYEWYSFLNMGGYDIEAGNDGISKTDLSNATTGFVNFQIKQLDDKGTAVETWTLVNPFIKSTNFGQLDYSSDELVKLELVISYDYAILE